MNYVYAILILIGCFLLVRNELMDLFVGWIEPHEENVTLYREYLNIGNKIIRCSEPKDFKKVRLLIEAFEQSNNDDIGKAYAAQLYQLLNRRRLQVSVPLN